MTFEQVARVVHGTEVLADFKDVGGSAKRWGRIDKMKMAECLTMAEDALEDDHPGLAGPDGRQRLALRRVRRELENEVWP